MLIPNERTIVVPSFVTRHANRQQYASQKENSIRNIRLRVCHQRELLLRRQNHVSPRTRRPAKQPYVHPPSHRGHATGHSAPQTHHPVLRMGDGEDGRGAVRENVTSINIPI